MARGSLACPKAMWPVIEKQQCKKSFPLVIYKNEIKVSSKFYRLLVNGLLCMIFTNKDIV